MSVINFPTTLVVSKASWAQVRKDMSFNSIFGSQSVEVSPPVWSVQMVSDSMNESSSGAWQSLLMQLKGQTNQLALWNVARPAPRGTMRGTMTINTTAAQGVTSLSIIASGEISKTLLQGDLIGVGTGATRQVVMVVADATSDGTGLITVTTEPALRNEQIATSAVEWDKPKAIFRRIQSTAKWDYESTFVSGLTLDLIEDSR